MENLFQASKYFCVEITRPNIMSRWKYPNILHFHHSIMFLYPSANYLLHIISFFLPPSAREKNYKYNQNHFLYFILFLPTQTFFFILPYALENSHVETRDEKLAERRKIIQCAQIFESRKGWSWRVISLPVTMVIDQIF